MTKESTSTTIRVVRHQIDEGALSQDQLDLLLRHAGCARQAWNWATDRWHRWRKDVDTYVWSKVREECDRAGLSTTEEILAEAVSLRHGNGHKAWRNNVYREADAYYGKAKLFQSAYELQKLYRKTAMIPDDPLNWWYREGEAAEANGVEEHGVSTYAYQTVFSDFKKTIKAYWENPRYSRKGHRQGAPRFKRRSDDAQGFALMNLTTRNTDPWKMIKGGHRLKFPNLGLLRMQRNTKRLRRLVKLGGRPTSARFTRQGGKWFVSVNVTMPATFLTPRKPNKTQRAGGCVGVDLGVHRLATLSTAELIPNPRHGKKSEERLAELTRRLDRQHRTGSPECFASDGTHVESGCQWGRGSVAKSRRAQTTQRQLTRLHSLIAQQRSTTNHALTKRLATNFELIAIEDLAIKNMTAKPAPRPDPDNPGGYLSNRRRAKAGLNRSILDAKLGEIRRQLTYKAGWYGATLHVVPRYYPSSKKCSHCREVKPKLFLHERIFECEKCHLVLDRDLNAAINLRGRAVTAPTDSGRDQDPTPPHSAPEVEETLNPRVTEAREGPLVHSNA